MAWGIALGAPADVKPLNPIVSPFATNAAASSGVSIAIRSQVECLIYDDSVRAPFIQMFEERRAAPYELMRPSMTSFSSCGNLPLHLGIGKEIVNQRAANRLVHRVPGLALAVSSRVRRCVMRAR
jgi:hypothetical protein